jgi:hypothetical protein
MNRRLTEFLTGTAAVLVAALAFAYFGVWQWIFCRVEVPPGSSLLLRYKGPFPFGTTQSAPEGTLVDLDSGGRPKMVGILAAMPGPGRHFYSPLEYERKLVPDILIKPGELGIVNSKAGKASPSGSYLVDEPGYRGTWRKVLTPGRYRMNDYAYDVKVVPVDACVDPATALSRREGDPTLIPPGYVGVVTNKTDDPRTKQVQGIQDRVLQPGLYYINPQEKVVSIVSIGYNETSLTVEQDPEATARATAEANARPALSPAEARLAARPVPRDPVYKPGKGIEFPSNDGFLIHLDYTAIWGIVPDQAPGVVRQFGNLKDVEQKVILPQIGSICRLHGSKRGAVDLLVGDTREAFQEESADELQRVLASKNLSLLFGLTRHIYVPAQVREPIQKGKIADELKLTSDQRQLTAKAQADLSEAKAKVVLEENRTKAETEKKVAQLAAEGEKSAREIAATTEKLRAQIDARAALTDAQASRTMGEARAKTIELANKAKAERYGQYVESLGGPAAYNRYVFAEGLPEDLRLGIFYAGPGTFWTDLKGFEQTMLGKLASDQTTAPTRSPRAIAPGNSAGMEPAAPR